MSQNQNGILSGFQAKTEAENFPIESGPRTLGVSKEQGETSIGSSTLVRLYECFIAGLGDYTMDRRFAIHKLLMTLVVNIHMKL